MQSEQATIDFTFAKSALFVRQAVAAAFEIPVDQELSWPTLGVLVCRQKSSSLPKQFLVRGLPSLALALPDEEKAFRIFLKEVGAARSDVSFRISIL